MALEIVPITLKEANQFVQDHHRHHGPVTGHKFSIAASDGERIVGVILLKRRRVSGALGWWMMVEDAVLAPTKRIAERMNAAPVASLETIVFVFVMVITSFVLIL